MRYFLRVLWAISLLSFLYVLFVGYGHMSDKVGIPLLSSTIYTSRNIFFYVNAVVALTISMLVLALSNLISRIPADYFPLPNKRFWLQDKYHQKALRVLINNWFFSILATINCWLMVIINNIASNNLNDGTADKILVWLPILAVLATLGCFAPLIRLYINKVNLLDNRKD